MSTSRTLRTLALTAAASVALLAGCGSSTPAAPSAATSGSAAGSEGAGTELRVARSSLGEIVVTADGMTAYYFTKDRANSGQSACADACLQAWPPITTSASAPTGEGISATLGTITLADGTKQVTANGLPIYLFAQDRAPGDVKGQGVNQAWYVIAPDGTMVRDQPAAPAY